MSTVETLKAALADLAEQHKTKMERDIQKLFALARLIDAEMAVRELEESRHD